MRSPRLLIPLVIALCGCPSSEPAPDPTPAPPVADPTVPASPGEARAAILPADDVAFAASTWGGIAAEARAGDIKLWNDRVRFVIRAQSGHGYVGVNGALIDADLVRPDGELGRDTLEEAFLAFGIGRLAGADSVVVHDDGLGGGSAIVRVTGADVPWTFVMGVIESDQPLTPAMGLEITTDYVLAPDSDVLEIRTRLRNPGSEVVRTNPLEGMIASGEDLFSFASDEGLAAGVADDPESIGVVGRQGEAAISMFLADGPLDRFAGADLLSGSGISLVSHGWTDIPAGGEVELVRFRAVGPDTLSVEAARWDRRGVALVGVSGVVSTTAGSPVAGARVHIVDEVPDPPRVLGFATTGNEGTWAARIPAGSYTAWVTARGGDTTVPLPGGAHRFAPFAHPDVNGRQLTALREGGAPELPFAVGHATPAGVPLEAVDGATADLELSSPGLIVVQVQDGTGARLPAVVEVLTVGPVASPVSDELRPGLGLPQTSGRVLRGWTPGWDLELPLPAGSYELRIEAGPRHERSTVLVDLAEGAEHQALVQLAEIVPRDGWLSMDSHLHGAPSNDGELPMEHRLIACAASGIDLPVTTDHDRLSDYRPLATALGLDSIMTVIPGVEVSPVLRGHFNLFPADPQGPSVTNGGAPSWWEGYDDTDALFDLIRTTPGAGDGLIQVNHGRESSGMMSASQFDPSVSEPFRPNFWSWGFDAVEIVNARGVGEWVPARNDWFSWLSTGRVRIPLGVSDSHGLGSPCGYGRTDVFLDTNDPAGLDSGALRAALLAGHVVVSGGPALRVLANGAGLPGDTVTGGTIDLAVTVRAPDWVRPDVVRLYRNGVLVQTEAIDATQPEPGLWWSGTLSDTPTADAWYVVEIEGATALGGPWGGAVPYAMANAVFLDQDGDGWDAPGP